MLALRYSLGAVRGVAVEAHASLLLLLGIAAVRQPHFASAALFFALGLGVVFLHEAAHAAVGRWFGQEPKKLSLHLFAGLSALDAPPHGTAADVWTTLAGPASSLLAGGAGVALGAALPPGWLGAAVRSAGLASLYWGALNLLPALPMDGGRLLRRALACCRGDLLRATLATGQTSQVVLSCVGLYGLLALEPAWMLFAAYLYLLHTIELPALLREAREAAETATVSPPPYARARPRRVDVTRVD